MLAARRLVPGVCRDRARWRSFRTYVLTLRSRSERLRLLRNHPFSSFILLNKTIDSFIQLENRELSARERGHEPRVGLHEASVCFGHLSQNLKNLIHLCTHALA